MNCTILFRRLPLRLKAFITLVLLSIFLIPGIPLTVHSSEVNQDTAKIAADTSTVGADTSTVATDTLTVQPDTSETKKEAMVVDHTHDNLKRGERFFKGLLPVGRQFESCVSCHNILPSDTLNWNPSAMDIALKYQGKDFAAFHGAVMQPNGIKIAEAHKGFEIEENDLMMIKLYLDEFATTGPPKMGPTITQILLFSGLVALLLLALADLMFFHKMKFRMVTILVLLISLGLITKMVAEAAIDLGRTQNYAPDQPIKFSHKVHAGDNKIDCKYCHHTAEFSKSANIPSMNLCMNCHVLVREGTHSGKFEISKVVEANESQKPVEWVRIHNLPDHVFFSHAQHVGVGKVDCKTCHGPVEEMDIMRQHSDLSMGWCINCHRETQVNFKDNAYYDNYKELHELIKSGKMDTVRAVDVGANDCMRCHY